MADTIELIARGIIVAEHTILLCRNTGSSYYYLPGGHVEFGETALFALERELDEEGGVTIQDLHWIGCVENIFTHDGKRRHELNVLFSGTVPTNAPITSREDHLELVWIPLTDVSTVVLLPKKLQTAVSQWLIDKKEIWETHLDPL